MTKQEDWLHEQTLKGHENCMTLFDEWRAGKLKREDLDSGINALGKDSKFLAISLGILLLQQAGERIQHKYAEIVQLKDQKRLAKK